MTMSGDSGHVSRADRLLEVDHVTIEISKPFDDVVEALEHVVPKLDTAYVTELEGGQPGRARDALQNGPDLSIFITRNHGALLRRWGSTRKAVQYEIGNPLTASSMTRYQLGAALYAPLRIVLYERASGSTVIEYDLPSSLFGQFGDERVTAIGRELDDKLNRAVLAAAAVCCAT